MTEDESDRINYTMAKLEAERQCAAGNVKYWRDGCRNLEKRIREIAKKRFGVRRALLKLLEEL